MVDFASDGWKSREGRLCCATMERPPRPDWTIGNADDFPRKSSGLFVAAANSQFLDRSNNLTGN